MAKFVLRNLTRDRTDGRIKTITRFAEASSEEVLRRDIRGEGGNPDHWLISKVSDLSQAEVRRRLLDLAAELGD